MTLTVGDHDVRFNGTSLHFYVDFYDHVVIILTVGGKLTVISLKRWERVWRNGGLSVFVFVSVAPEMSWFL